MKKMFCLLLVFWLSLLISHCAGPIEQPTGSVEGAVKDSDRQPIEGARVVVDTTNLQAITDSRGNYRLASVPAGQRTLIASKSGYAREIKVVNVGAGQIVKVDFTLQTQGAQQVVWQKTFGGSDDDRARSVQETIDGGYVVAGYTWSSSEREDVYILKLDARGNKLWEKTFGGSDNDGAWSIQQTNDGGYVVAGYTSSFGAGSYDVYVLKLDTSGKEVWSKTFGGSSDDLAWSIQQTNDGGYIVAGYTSSFGVGNYDVYIIKMDANGNTGAYPTGDE